MYVMVYTDIYMHTCTQVFSLQIGMNNLEMLLFFQEDNAFSVTVMTAVCTGKCSLTGISVSQGQCFSWYNIFSKSEVKKKNL